MTNSPQLQSTTKMQTLSRSKSFGFIPTIHITNHLNWRQKTSPNFPPSITNFPTLTPTIRHTLTKKSSMAKPKKKEVKTNITKTDKKQYWLLKTEPGEWSWDDQSANNGLSNWDGVKNRQAIKNLKSMRLNDLCFFYHSGTKARRVVGVVSVVREWYADGDEEFVGAVDVKAVGEMRRAVDLKEMKEEVGFKDFGLIRQPRLSVVPVDESVWDRVCELGGGYDGDGRVVIDE